MKSAKRIYAENISWEASESRAAERSRKLWKVGTVSGWALAILCTASVAPLMHFQHIVPAVILVDRATGDYKVERDGHALTVAGSAESQARFFSDLGKYVKAREGFTRGEADVNYSTVWLMSSPEIRGQWDAFYKPDLNKQSPLNTMQSADSIKLANLSFSTLPSSEPGVHVAQVRYDLVKQIGQLPPTTQRMVSTVTFKYDSANVPSDMDEYILNAFGFEVVNYRRDEDGIVRQITPAQVQQQGSAYVPAAPMQPVAMPQPSQVATSSAARLPGLNNLISGSRQ
jgi:type IV secretory pathway component VirB8